MQWHQLGPLMYAHFTVLRIVSPQIYAYVHAQNIPSTRRGSTCVICHCLSFNLLVPGKVEWIFRYLHVILQIISVIDGWGISCELALRWMSLDLTDDKSTLVQVMAWSHGQFESSVNAICQRIIMWILCILLNNIMINNENSTNLSVDSLQAPQIQIVWGFLSGPRDRQWYHVLLASKP